MSGLIGIKVDDGPLQPLMFGALISAVDPVATLAIFGSAELNVEPTLYVAAWGAGRRVQPRAGCSRLTVLFLRANDAQVQPRLRRKRP